MAKFLNTSKAYAEIEELVTKAKQELVLISPFIKIPQRFLERLRDIDKRNIKITLVCKENELKQEEAVSLAQLRSLELRFLENLHAKCFYNEEAMVITSLNLHDYSQQHNREMGILLTLGDDKEVYSEARNEAEFIIRTAVPDKSRRQISEPRPRYEASLKNVVAQYGFCIRCGGKIPFDPDAPYCRSCFAEWARWENPDYEEGFCHECGKPSNTTMVKPRCRSCYDRS